MKLSEIFDALATGELSGLNLVRDGEINPAKYRSAVTSINLGLIQLASRFNLRRETLVLKTRSDLRSYELDYAYTLSSGNQNAYVLDSVNEPFDHRLLEVLKVTDSEGNDALDRTLVKVTPTTLRTIEPDDATYTVEYSALLKQIPTDWAAPFRQNEIEVELPYNYLTALLYFVASRHYTPTLSNADSNRGTLDMNYLQRYEAECALLVARGVDVDRDDEVSLFTSRGFI